MKPIARKKSIAPSPSIAQKKSKTSAPSIASFIGILDSMQSQRVLVIGDVGIDRYTHGTVERISPEAPVPVVLVDSESHKMGLAANCADNVHALGGACDLIGVIGKDRFAEDFRVMLRAVGVSGTSLVVDPTRRTTVKERVVSDRQQIVRIDYESAHPVGPSVETQILATFKKNLPQCDIVILQDYAKGMLSPELIQRLFALAKAAGKPVAVDPNAKSPLSLYAGAGVLTPNTKEAEALSGLAIRDEESLIRVGKKILTTTRANHVVVTRGKDGMAIFSRGSSRMQRIPTFAREVYDVSGAGDTVISVLSLALAAGASIVEAAVLGNLGAGVVVGKRGTATVTQNEMRAALESAGHAGLLGSKTLSESGGARGR